MALPRDIWINTVQDTVFRVKAMEGFLRNSKDYTEQLSRNLTLNFPFDNQTVNILKNRYPSTLSYPTTSTVTPGVPIVWSTDNVFSIEGDVFESEAVAIPRAGLSDIVSYELERSKMDSVTLKMQQDILRNGFYRLAPATDSALSPIILATGTAMPDSLFGPNKINITGATGAKGLYPRLEDLLQAQYAFNAANLPDEGRMLFLNSAHALGLRRSLADYQRPAIDAAPSGVLEQFPTTLIGNFAGFEIYEVPPQYMPVYNTTGALTQPTKPAFGAAAAPATNCICSVFALGSKTLYASAQPYLNFNNLPQHHGNVFSLSLRAYIGPMNPNAYIGAIVSTR